MRKTLIPSLSALILALLAGCTKSENIIYEDEIDFKVYFVQAVTSPLQTVAESSLDESGNVTFCIYSAGNNGKSITVDVFPDQDALDIYNVENGTSYRMLPQKYWSLAQDSFVMDTREHYQAYVQLSVDFDAVRSDGLDTGSYLLPLSVSVPGLSKLTYDYRTLLISISL